METSTGISNSRRRAGIGLVLATGLLHLGAFVALALPPMHRGHSFAMRTNAAE